MASASYGARHWAGLVTWSASLLGEPDSGDLPPPVRLTPPSGRALTSDVPQIDRLLSQRLAREARLMLARQVGEASSRGDQQAGAIWDVHPVHLLTTGTLARLARAAPDATFDPRRFRPNLVIETGQRPGFVEDGWLGRTLRVGAVRLRIVDHAPRCVMTTHAQGPLPRDPGILRTAARANAGSVGVYAAVEAPGPVRVGDAVLVEPEA